MTPTLITKIYAGLAEASRDITRNWGGQIAPEIETAWRQTHDAAQALEPIS